MKFNDRNANGTWEQTQNANNEEGLEWYFDWKYVHEDNNAWREYRTYSGTGEGGRIGGLNAGDRIVIRERSRDGWRATTATQVEITLRDNDTIIVRFGNVSTSPTPTPTPTPTVPSVEQATPPKQLPKTGTQDVIMIFGAGISTILGAMVRRWLRE
ncbi:MAG TPA: hypothetical protein DCW55_02010 [Candidatus Pacebacteria bacterium]|nr:hypothetical protein [Candidatus Paceibacterota bacterium]